MSNVQMLKVEVDEKGLTYLERSSFSGSFIQMVSEETFSNMRQTLIGLEKILECDKFSQV